MRPVWRNDCGGLTFEVTSLSGRRFVKWAPAGSGLDLTAEADRLRWAAPFTPVPTVLGEGRDGAGSWLVTAGLPGRNAVDERWKADPRRAVQAIGRGLRAFHDALPVAVCPFSWSVADRLADAAPWATTERRRRCLAELAAGAPPVDVLVVCQGDACPPNTLLADDGTWSGHVDLGAMGVADRWADLAVATCSLGWNYGPGWEPALLDAYGVVPDDDRTAFYNRLWQVGP
nr:aminoglycoside 3'-phosphotransferase [Parafrankia colletiae]